MKKVKAAFALIFVSALSFSACEETNIKPEPEDDYSVTEIQDQRSEEGTGNNNSGGGGEQPPGSN